MMIALKLGIKIMSGLHTAKQHRNLIADPVLKSIWATVARRSPPPAAAGPDV
jgi:hypothetical protein